MTYMDALWGETPHWIRWLTISLPILAIFWRLIHDWRVRRGEELPPIIIPRRRDVMLAPPTRGRALELARGQQVAMATRADQMPQLGRRVVKKRYFETITYDETREIGQDEYEDNSQPSRGRNLKVI